jgi:hypothetical protein
VHKNAVQIEKGKQLYLEEARRRGGATEQKKEGYMYPSFFCSVGSPSLTFKFQATVRFLRLGTSEPERMSLRREVRPT